MGRLTRDPEVRYTQGDNPMCIANFTVAVDRTFKSKREGDPTADFIPCVVFGKLAEHVQKYYCKGLKTALTGRIQTRNYTNRDGVKVYVTEVVVEHLEFAESKNASGSQNNSTPQQGYAQPAQGGYQQAPGTPQGGYGAPAQGGYQNQQGGYQNQQGGYGAPAQGGYGMPPQGGYQNQAGQNDGAYSGFMNIPDGIDEELPFS